MGERIDAAGNGVQEVLGEQVVFCPICGDPDGEPVQGHGTLEFVEANWIEVDGSLYCNIEHAALGAGLSAAQAQLAKAEAARRLLREQGYDAIADADEARVQDIVDNPEAHPYSVALEEVADEDTHERETPDEEKIVMSQEMQDFATEVFEHLARGED